MLQLTVENDSKKPQPFTAAIEKSGFGLYWDFFFLTKRKITSTNYALKHNDPLV